MRGLEMSEEVNMWGGSEYVGRDKNAVKCKIMLLRSILCS